MPYAKLNCARGKIAARNAVITAPSRENATPSEAAVPRKSKPRADFVDALKGLVIVLVVICHESQGIRRAGIFVPEAFAVIDRYSYSFFMPLMFLLSGLFIEGSLRKGKAEFLSARLRTLVYPFVLWSLITGPTMLLASKVVNHSVSKNPLMWLTLHPLGPLWFLEALILCQLAYGLLRFLRVDTRVIAVLFMICTCIGAFLPEDIGPQTLFSLGFFGLGAALSRWILQLPRKNVVLLIAAAAALEAVHLILLSAYPLPYTVVAMSLVGSAVYVLAGAAFGNAKGLAFLRSIGSASIAIYVMHTMVAGCVRILLHKGLNITDPALHLSLGIASGLLIPWALWYFLDRRFPWLFRWPAAPRKADGQVVSSVAYEPAG